MNRTTEEGRMQSRYQTASNIALSSSTFMLMNTSMDPMQFCVLDIHIISDIEKQESFLRLRPKLDIPYYYAVAWHSRTSFTSRPLHSYQARPRHNSHTDEFTIIVTPITQNEIHSSLQFLNHHNNRIIARYITAMDTYWRWSITHFLEITYYHIRLKKRLKRPLAVWFQLWKVFIHSSDETRCVDEAIDESLLHSVKASWAILGPTKRDSSILVTL